MAIVWILILVILGVENPAEGQNVFEILSMSNSGGTGRTMQSGGTGRTVQSEYSGGRVVELDILEQEHFYRSKRAAISDGHFYWRNNLIRYEIDDGVLDAESASIIREAIYDWSYLTCIEFVEGRTSRNYLFFTSIGYICQSSVGSLGDTQRNEILLGPWCRKQKHVILHEIGHAIGLYHEHTRPDRDEHVEILIENVKINQRGNFQKRESTEINSRDIPYDYKSIMHYEKNAWAKDRNNLTIRTLDPKDQDIIGTAMDLSFGDIKVVNLMYNCNAQCSEEDKAKDCPGEGFVGKDCRCWCPSDSVIYEICDACPIPDTPLHGTKQGSEHIFRSTVNFACDPDYTLIGASSITCTGLGYWDAAVPSCEYDGENTDCQDTQPFCPLVTDLCNVSFVNISCPLSCNSCTPEPMCPKLSIENGDSQGTEPFTESSTATFVCDPDFSLSGSSTSTCSDVNNNLQWNPPPPTCQQNCGDPGSPINGLKIGTTYTYLSAVVFTCDVGYRLVGSASITCGVNGLWSDAIPTCEIVSCPNPGVPSNGRVIGGSYTYGSTVQFECDTGHNLIGSSSILCQGNEQWSSSLPTCNTVEDVAVNCNFDNGFCGFVVFSRWTLVTSDTGQYAVFRQINDFRRAIMKSPDFNQVDQQHQCLTFKGLVENSKQGRMIIYSQNFRQLWNSRHVITTTDWRSFNLVIPPTVTSLYFVATNYYSTVGHIGIDDVELQTGICDASGICSDPGVPSFGGVLFDRLDSYSEGSVINFYCDAGYYPLTPMIIKCLPNGRWDGPVTYCRGGQNAPVLRDYVDEDIICDDADSCQRFNPQDAVDYIELPQSNSCCLRPLQADPETRPGHCDTCLAFCRDASAVENCDILCGCSDTQSATTTTTTTTPTTTTTTTTGTCDDEWNVCDLYKNYCDDEYVAVHCRKMCGCPQVRKKRDVNEDVKENIVHQQNTVSDPDCIDTTTNCYEWSVKGGCRISSFIRKQCRLSCGMCNE